MFKDCRNDISEHKDNISDILDNFHHLLSFHDTDKDFESIYKQLHSCNINDCKLFARNYRNRDKIKDNNQKRKELYNTNDTDIISLYQIMDKIHCYYYHTYDIKFREKPNINIIEDKKSVDENKNDNEEKINTEIINNNFRISGKFNQLTADPVYIDGTSGKSAAYSFGTKFKYRKYSGIDFDVHTNMKLVLIQPRYQNLKEELTQNTISIISVEQYQNEYQKAEIHHQSVYRKTNHKRLNVEQLLTLMVYTNFDVLQCKFSETYRINIQKHEEFYHLGNILQSIIWCSSVNPSGVSEDDEKLEEKIKLFHGISTKLSFPAYIECHISSPLSTTTSCAVAINFAGNNQGLIIEFGIKNYQERNYISVVWLSDYANEQERLFVQSGMHLQMTNIIDPKTNIEYAMILKAMFIISKLLKSIKGLNWNVSDKMKSLITNIIKHQLSQKLPHKYNRQTYEIKTLNGYARQMLNVFFDLQNYVEFDYLHWCKKHEYLRNVLFEENIEWIKMCEFNALFPNVPYVQIWHINLCSAVFEDIMKYYSQMNFKSVTFFTPRPSSAFFSASFNRYEQLFESSNVKLSSVMDSTEGEYSFVSIDWNN